MSKKLSMLMRWSISNRQCHAGQSQSAWRGGRLLRECQSLVDLPRVTLPHKFYPTFLCQKNRSEGKFNRHFHAITATTTTTTNYYYYYYYSLLAGKL